LTLAAALQSVRISEVWAALGGGPLRLNRGRAFWRAGDGENISLNDRKGTWYDFRDNRGGGILDLIQLAAGCDRAGAVAWLASAFSLPIDGQRHLTPRERRVWARKRAEAEHVLEWRHVQLEELRSRRNFHLESYHRALRLVLTCGLNHPRADQWATACEQHESAYLRLDQEIDAFESAPPERIVTSYRAAVGGAA
jgi:hypothetical protein